MVAESDIGVSGPTYKFPVELGKVREFARATGYTDPAYFEQENPRIPISFLGVAGRMWGYTFDDPKDTPLADVEIDRSLLLHAGEEYEIVGEFPRAGDVLFVRTYIKNVFLKEGRKGGTMTFVTTETEFKNEGGDLVAKSEQTVVKTASAP